MLARMDPMADGARSHNHNGNGGMGTAALLEIARDLAHAHGEQEIAAIITGRVVDAVRADAGAAYMLEPDGVHLNLVAQRGHANHGSPKRLPLDLDLPLPACVREGNAIFLSSREEMISRFPALAELLRTPNAKRAACVCLPLLSEDKAVGGVVFGFDRPHAFDADERAFFLTIKNHASVAVERSQLRDSERGARKRLEIVSDISRRIAETRLSVTDVAKIVTHSIAEAFQGTCVLSLVSRSNDGLEQVAMHDVDAERLRSVDAVFTRAPIRLDEPSVLARVATMGRPIFFDRVDLAALISTTPQPAYREQLERFPIRSLASLPLRAAGEVIGTLTLSSPIEGPGLVVADEEMLVELADRAALAIRAARLHETALAAVRSREDLLAVVSHDLRNLVQGVALGVAITHDIAGANPAVAKATKSIRRSIDRMETLIRNLLDLAMLDAGRLNVRPVPVSLPQSIEEAIALHAPLASERSITLASHIAPTVDHVLATPELLAQIVANLFGNALKFTPPGGSISVTAENNGPLIAISVSDTGRGIDPADLPHIFDRYWQAQRRSQHSGGVGLGLAIVHGIVTALGGKLHVESQLECGTTFRFTLPAA
jgi:signal transduction histidine kinase